MQLPIGYDNFAELIEKKLDFVDKSLFIQEILDHKSTKVTVITRPRRFGKTLNLSMLHHFLAAEVDGHSAQDLFNGLKISEEKALCLQHQGKYPVIFITFKDMKADSFEAAYQNLLKLMSTLYSEHIDLLNSTRLNAAQKATFEHMLYKKADEADVRNAIKDMTHYLYLHYGIKPWLLIDEYDTPLQSAYTYDYYEPMVELMRNLLGAALKTNAALDRAVITGILKISKESLFSGLNNLKVYSLLHSQYSQHFGFTEAEVQNLLNLAQLENRLDPIRTWYNGYQFGETVVYNPWSIINCIQDGGQLIPYWVNTSDEQLIRRMVVRSREEFKTGLEALLREETIERVIDENMVFGDLTQGSEVATWSLLLMAGYLKVTKKHLTDRGEWLCQLQLPNREVRSFYFQIIERWLANGHGLTWYSEFVERLLTGKLDLFERDLRKILAETASYHDMAQEPEAFFHGFMMGLTISVHYDPRYELTSNKESGYGRYDYLIFSKDPQRPTILLEFKRVDAIKDEDQLTLTLTAAAEAALAQIERQGYLAVVQQRGATQVLKIGLAFCGKRFVLAQG